MLAPIRVSPKEAKKQAKLSERRAAAKAAKLINDFNARWLCLKNDAFKQCATGDEYSYCIYAIGMYALIGLKAIESEDFAIAEQWPIDCITKMRDALGDVAELEGFNFDLRSALMGGLEVIEAITEPLDIKSIALAWKYVDSGLKQQTLTTKSLDELILRLQITPPETPRQIMKIEVEAAPASVIISLKENGPQDIEGLIASTGRSYAAITSIIYKLRTIHKNKYTVRAGSRKNARNMDAFVYDLHPDLKDFSLEEIKAAIVKPAHPARVRKQAKENNQPTPLTKVQARNALAEGSEIVDFIRLNALYMSSSQIALHLGKRQETVEAIASEAGIYLGEEYREPRSFEIKDSLDFIPAGSQIEQWQKGTCFHMPCDIPGINRVTRHFAADD